MSVKATHEVLCDQCHVTGPTIESLVEDNQGWFMALEINGESARQIDLCPRCRQEWE